MSASLTAADCQLVVCEVCGKLSPVAAPGRCPRCHAPLHLRKPDGLSRCWALLLAAYALYLPANLLPIMETRSPFGTELSTIMDGGIRIKRWTK